MLYTILYLIWYVIFVNISLYKLNLSISLKIRKSKHVLWNVFRSIEFTLNLIESFKIMVIIQTHPKTPKVHFRKLNILKKHIFENIHFKHDIVCCFLWHYWKWYNSITIIIYNMLWSTQPNMYEWKSTVAAAAAAAVRQSSRPAPPRTGPARRCCQGCRYCGILFIAVQHAT